MNNRKLVLENGQVFNGVGFGSKNEVVAEIIYNTAVVGYQELISDPANAKKIVCMTYPLIGNYGLTDEDYESKYLAVNGLIVREYNEIPSNFRYTKTLEEVMEESNISGIEKVDTRSLMRVIRDNGVMKALICDIDKPLEECMAIINAYKEDADLVKLVSTKKIWYSRTPNPVYNVAVIDLGCKLNFIKSLNKKGCNVICFPYNTSKEEILKYKPNGLLISSGPGDPNNLEDVVTVIKSLIGVVPLFGIGLGSLILGLAYGTKVTKMKCGHHGGNYPVRNLVTGKVEITTQNHLYSIETESFGKTKLEARHQNIITNEIEGFVNKHDNVMGINFEPVGIIDADTEDVYQEFIDLMKK